MITDLFLILPNVWSRCTLDTPIPYLEPRTKFIPRCLLETWAFRFPETNQF